VFVVQLATGRVLRTRTMADGSDEVEFSNDGRELIALGCCNPGSTLVAWDTYSGDPLFTLKNPGGETFDISPDSHLLTLGMPDGKVLFLDPRTGKQVQPLLQAAAGDISDVSFSPDGRSIVVGAGDNAASVWDLQSRKRVGNAFGPYRPLFPFALFEPDGRLLIILQGNAVQWPTDVKAWERGACRAAGRNLTRAEWHDLLPDRAYRPICAASTR
jgi:WD40 repeat protein